MLILEWRPLRSGTLLGHADVETTSGYVFHSCGVFQNGERTWASVPADKRIGSDGQPVIGANGKAIYTSQVTIPDRGRRDQWSDQVIAALRQQYPQAIPRVPAEAAA